MGVFDRALSVTGLSWEELIAKGIAKLYDELDGDKIVFEAVDNGIRISIACDDDEKKEAAMLWENNVKPELQGGSE